MYRFLIGILLGFISLMAFFSGFHLGFSIFAAVFVLLIVMATYLETRSLAAPASKVEILVARLWLMLRLLGCMLVSAVFFVMALYAGYKIYLGSMDVSSWAFLLVSLGLTCMTLWVGLYGWSRHLLRDRALQAARKIRYSGAANDI